MPTLVQCPACATAFTYSPALLGRTVQCWQCAHTFTVALPLAAEAPYAEAVAATSGTRTLMPPPLPARGARDQMARSVASLSTRTDEQNGGEEHDVDRPRRRRPEHDRPTGTGTLVGLLGVFLLGFVVLLAGSAYLLWPNSSKATAPAVQGPLPPAQTPVAEEPQKNLKDILNDVPARGPVNPARPTRPR